MKYTKTQKKGFTLIEVLISITIFSIVMVIAVGALVTMFDANRKSQSLQLAVNNVNAALDSMTWKIRGGSDYECMDGEHNQVTDCSGADNEQPGLRFTGNDNLEYEYWLEDGRIKRSTEGADAVDLTSTSPLVTVNKLGFSILGGSGSEGQPAVTINLRGEAGVKGKSKSDFNLQTAVSERFNVTYEGGDSNASTFKKCPFPEKLGRTIVDFVDVGEKGKDVTVRADHFDKNAIKNAKDSTSGPWPNDKSAIEKLLTIPVGNYNIMAATFDEGNQDQPTKKPFQDKEIAYFGLLNGGRDNDDIFAYTKRTDDIPKLNPNVECHYDPVSAPTCFREQQTTVATNLYIKKPVEYIKVFHGQPLWENFDDDERDDGIEEAVDKYGFDPHHPEYFASIRDKSKSQCGGEKIPSYQHGCPNSFVVICMAFDNLDTTSQLEYEDF